MAVGAFLCNFLHFSAILERFEELSENEPIGFGPAAAVKNLF